MLDSETRVAGGCTALEFNSVFDSAVDTTLGRAACRWLDIRVVEQPETTDQMQPLKATSFKLIRPRNISRTLC